MNIVSSLEYGRKPFTPDKTRGHWGSLTDYISASIGVGFKLDLSSFYWMFLFQSGVLDIIPYMVFLLVFGVPLMMLYSYLGQFSSSGYISALRVSPLFKGIGYIGLTINFCVLTFLSTYVTTPLFYFINSFWPTLPWSCEGIREWNTAEEHMCNETLTAFVNASMNSTFLENKYLIVNVPSVLFYRHQFNGNIFSYGLKPENLHTPWQLIAYNLLVWGTVAYIFHICRSTEKFGRLLTILLGTSFGLMLICLVRFLFLPAAQWKFTDIFIFDWRLLNTALQEAPLIALQVFGQGWGSILSVASYNKFPTDFGRSVWIICGGHILIMGCFGLMNALLEGHLNDSINLDTSIAFLDLSYSMILSSGTALANLGFPNFWCFMYYGMLVLSSLLVLLIQAHSFITALFDEFVQLRERKDMVIFGLLGLWAFLSFHQYTWSGSMYHVYLSLDAQVVQQSLHLLVLLVLMWGYGHERLRRDLEFMIGYRVPDWAMIMTRFVSPLFLVCALLLSLENSFSIFIGETDLLGWVSFLCITLPWVAFPLMIGYQLRQSTGPLRQRWKKICQPTDWYPVDHEDRRRYDEAFRDDTVDGTQQLDEELDAA